MKFYRFLASACIIFLVQSCQLGEAPAPARPNKIDPNPKIEITCSLSPCLTPTGKVSVRVNLTSIFSGTSASATAIQTVDAWRSS